jgi:hypothetical protein
MMFSKTSLQEEEKIIGELSRGKVLSWERQGATTIVSGHELEDVSRFPRSHLSNRTLHRPASVFHFARAEGPLHELKQVE